MHYASSLLIAEDSRSRPPRLSRGPARTEGIAQANLSVRAMRAPRAAYQAPGLGHLGKCPHLYLAAEKGAPRSTIDLLAAKGADVGWADEHGQTALHQAVYLGHAEVVRALGGTHGADLNAQDNDGDAPLHYAAYYGRTTAARALLELGADASLRNKKGQTALGMAVHQGKHKVAQLLRDHSSSDAPQFPTGGAAGAPAPAPTPLAQLIAMSFAPAAAEAALAACVGDVSQAVAALVAQPQAVEPEPEPELPPMPLSLVSGRALVTPTLRWPMMTRRRRESSRSEAS